MRTFRAKIHETDGHYVEPEYMADDEFWRWRDPKTYLIGFWGLREADVESYELYEVVDGKEVVI